MSIQVIWRQKCVKCHEAYGWKDDNNKPIRKPRLGIVKITHGVCDACLAELIGVSIPITGLA